MAKKTRDKDFDLALNAMKKQFGDAYATRGICTTGYSAIPTGYDDLDDVLTKGARGIYMGGIVEIFGPEHSGKTSLALRTVSEAQKLGHHCVWLDAEATFAYDLAEINGVDLEALIMPELANMDVTDTKRSSGIVDARKLLHMIYRTLCTQQFKLIVVDSIAGLMPERILKADHKAGDQGIGEVANAMAEYLRPISSACQATQSSVICVNQLRDQPGKMFQNPYHTPGGNAIKFWASQRINVSKVMGAKGRVVVTDEEGEQEVIGHYANITIVKNKRNKPLPPGYVLQVPIYYTEYSPDNAKLCYDLARNLQVIKINKGNLSWKDDDDNPILKVKGEAEILDVIRKNNLESRLASACVKAAAGERNQGLKQPHKVPHAVSVLAESHDPSSEQEVIIEDDNDEMAL